MNWLDILLIIINLLVLLFGIIAIVMAFIKKDDYYSEWLGITIGFWIIYIFCGWLLWGWFVVIDKASGSTIGTITSVDKNFFGTTALYIKTSETEQEEYCIEFDKKLEKQAKELIGQKVKISYGKRVGLYSTGKCSQAPIEKIELVEN